MKGYLKWQDLAKVLGPTASIILVLVGILSLAGMSYTVPPDIVCGTDCYSKIEINSSYWEICVEHSNSSEMIYKKVDLSRRLWINLNRIQDFIPTNPEVKVELLVPTTSKYATVKNEYGYLRPVKDGDCIIKRTTISNPGPNKLIVHGSKEALQTVKWGFKLEHYLMQDIKIDPVWYGEEQRLRTDGFIGNFIPSNEIRIESQSYFGKFIDYQFQEINNTHWLANYSVNEDLKNSIQTCLLSAGKLSCFKTFCDTYLSDFMNSINATCNSTKQYVWNDVLKLADWKLTSLTKGIKFDRNSINYLTDGSFYIIFPEGFKENERASFGNPFDPEVTMIPNPSNATTYNGTIAETTHPAVTAGTVFVDASYNLVNTSNDQYARTTGSATVDAYVRTNFYLPQSIYYLNWIYVTVELKNTANTDALHLALYNYTSGLFVDVNTTASSTTDKNLTFNISGSNITNFVDYRNMNVLTHLSGTSADNLDVDYISALVSYNNPNSPIIINTGTAIPWYNHQRAICKDGAGNLHVVWRYNASQIYYANSSNGGTTWTLNQSFRNGTYGNTRLYPHISCDGNNITVAYEDSTLDDLMVAISTNNGATWTWKNPVTSGVYGTFGETLVERKGSNIYVIFQNQSSTMDLEFINSTDGGTTWGSRITAATGSTSTLYPSIAVNGSGTASDKIYVVFKDSGDSDIYFVNSTDSGATWGTKLNLHAGTFVRPSTTFSGVNLYVAYDTSSDIYFINSTDSGITWRTGYTLKTAGTTIFPSVTLTDLGNPIVFWEDNGVNANKDIVYMKHNGTAWETQVNLTNNNFGNTYVNTPYTYYSDNKIHYIWRNGTASPYQIMYDYISLAVADTTPPTYSLNSTNSTLAGTVVEHSLKWTDNVNTSGYIFQFCNGTWSGSSCGGSGWANDSFVFFYGNQSWSESSCTWSDNTYECKTAGIEGECTVASWCLIDACDKGCTARDHTTSSSASCSGTASSCTCNGPLGFKLCNGESGVCGALTGTCSYTCSSGWWNCDGNTANGCEHSGPCNTTWSNVTKTVNSTSGATIAWCVYANDTSNNWNTSLTYSYVTTSAGTTCDCSSIQVGTSINCAENCDIGACNVGGIAVAFINTGTITTSGDVTNILRTNWSPGCKVVIGSGKRWGG